MGVRVMDKPLGTRDFPYKRNIDDDLIDLLDYWIAPDVLENEGDNLIESIKELFIKHGYSTPTKNKVGK